MDAKDQKIGVLEKLIELLERKNLRLKCQHNVEIQEMLARQNGIKESLNVELDRNDELDIEVGCLTEESKQLKEGVGVAVETVARLTGKVTELANKILLLEGFLENENICHACGSKDFQDGECRDCEQYHLDKHNDAQLDRKGGK